MSDNKKRKQKTIPSFEELSSRQQKDLISATIKGLVNDFRVDYYQNEDELIALGDKRRH